MEHNTKMIAPEQLIPPLLELLEDIPSVPLVISGDSMTPFLCHGRDTVYLSRITAPPKKGDMILYLRDNGRYVLHRVYRVEDGRYTMVGDAQTLLEPGIRRDQMLAVVSAVCRNEKLLKKGDFWWDFFETHWLRLLPMRPTIRRVYSRLKKFL